MTIPASPRASHTTWCTRKNANSQLHSDAIRIFLTRLQLQLEWKWLVSWALAKFTLRPQRGRIYVARCISKKLRPHRGRMFARWCIHKVRMRSTFYRQVFTSSWIGSYSVKLNIHYRLFFCNYLKTNIILNEVQNVHYNYLKHDPKELTGRNKSKRAV